MTIAFSVLEFYPYKKGLPSSSFETALRGRSDTIPGHIKWAVVQKGNELVMKEKAKTQPSNETEPPNKSRWNISVL